MPRQELPISGVEAERRRRRLTGLAARPASRVGPVVRDVCARHGAHDPFLMFRPLRHFCSAVGLADLRPPLAFGGPPGGLHVFS